MATNDNIDGNKNAAEFDESDLYPTEDRSIEIAQATTGNDEDIQPVEADDGEQTGSDENQTIEEVVVLP